MRDFHLSARIKRKVKYSAGVCMRERLREMYTYICLMYISFMRVGNVGGENVYVSVTSKLKLQRGLARGFDRIGSYMGRVFYYKVLARPCTLFFVEGLWSIRLVRYGFTRLPYVNVSIYYIVPGILKNS